MLAVLDLGVGNLSSVVRAFGRLGESATVVSDPQGLVWATRLVLAGVGSFGAAMEKIEETSGMRETLEQKAIVDRIPVFGICLGMQLMFGASEESEDPGLGWLAGESKRFISLPGRKVPHVGWNLSTEMDVVSSIPATPLEASYYFNHSYYVQPGQSFEAERFSHYGHAFLSEFRLGNLSGVQFHPEKSYTQGENVLREFLAS